MASSYLTEKFSIKLDAETLEQLQRLADIGDRSVAAEIRRALRAHVLAAAEHQEATA